MKTLTEQLKVAITPTLEALGYELWGLVYQPRGGKSVLQIFIEKEEGVTIDDCERASRHISSVLDAENLIQNAYTLELSSPGLDRTLFELTHYKKYIGKAIKLKLFEPVNHQRSFAGQLVDVTDEGVVRLDIDGKLVEFTFGKIQTGQVIF